MNRIVDAKGLPCPQPVVRAKDALKEMKNGTLLVLVDNEIAVQNLVKLGSYSNLKTVSEKVSEGEFRVLFSVEAGAADQTQVEENCIPDSRQKGMIAVISSDCMGSGEEALGRILMKGFLYAMTQLDRLPETVLLYNGGAKLSVEGSESIEDLKNLEAQGVEILTCGTCLNYYGLSDKLRVGGVTNMYEIVEKMACAGTVIRP